MLLPLQEQMSAGALRRHLPRVLLSLLFILPGSAKLLVPFDIVGPNYGAGEPFMTSLRDTGYLFTLLALTQIAAGLLLLLNRFIPLALTLLAPIIVNIALFHLFLNPTVQGWLMTGLVLGLELHLVYRYREVFRPFFKARPST